MRTDVSATTIADLTREPPLVSSGRFGEFDQLPRGDVELTCQLTKPSL